MIRRVQNFWMLKIIKKMKCENTAMRFVDLGSIENWTIEGYGDAGFKSLPDKTSSCGGSVVMITNKVEGKSSILNWRSNKIKRVVSSSTAAEALAAAAAARAAAGPAQHGHRAGISRRPHSKERVSCRRQWQASEASEVQASRVLPT